MKGLKTRKKGIGYFVIYFLLLYYIIYIIIYIDIYIVYKLYFLRG